MSKRSNTLKYLRHINRISQPKKRCEIWPPEAETGARASFPCAGADPVARHLNHKRLNTRVMTTRPWRSLGYY